MKKVFFSKPLIFTSALFALTTSHAGITIQPDDGSSGNQTPHVACSSAIDLLGGGNPREVTLSGSGSSDPDGTIIEYKWTLGDGSTRYGESITHHFYPPSDQLSWIYYPSLKVTDNEGKQSVSINCGGVPTGRDVIWDVDVDDGVSGPAYYWLDGATTWHVGDGAILNSYWNF